MARITAEDCLDKVTNRFALILLCSKRTKQLRSGATPLISTGKNKSVVTALREIATGGVRFMSKEDIEERAAREAAEAEARAAEEMATAEAVAPSTDAAPAGSEVESGEATEAVDLGATTENGDERV